MGNSNSSGGGGHHRGHGGRNHHHHHPHQSQWTSHSLETPEQRNRMKRGYFPPRPYIGHPGLPQPQKVLPSSAIAAPSKLLKPTSNGAILHGGGTISGRKLSEMTDADRKRSTVSCPAVDYPMGSGGGLSSGRSTPNLASVGLSGGHSGPRRPGSGSRGSYGSEPDLRDVGIAMMEPCHPGNCPNMSRNHSPLDDTGGLESPLPNSFTLISESPAKKQIRSRKKSKAPPPPPGSSPCCVPPEMVNGYLITSNGHHGPYPSPMGGMYPPMPQPYILQQRHFLPPSEAEGKGKKLRLFKTKAESKSAANSPAIRSPPSSELIFPLERPSSTSQAHPQHPHQFPMRGAPMRASLDANRLLLARNENNNKEHIRHQQLLQHHHQQAQVHHQHNQQVIARPSSSQLIERESKGEAKQNYLRGEVQMKNSGNNKTSSNNNSGRLSSSSGAPLCSPKEREVGGDSKRPGLLMGSHAPESSVVPPGSTSSGSNASNSRQVPNSGEQKKMKGKAGGPGAAETAANKNGGAITPDEKKTFYFGMDMGTFKHQKDKHDKMSKQVANGAPAGLNEDLHKEISRRKMVKQIEEEIKGEGVSSNGKSKNAPHPGKVPAGKKISNGNLRSESDSDGLHRRQDSGNFELNDKVSSGGGKGAGGGGRKERESSSDLSSSDLDVPLVVTRPTLPQKRPDLPRFSPTAAWRALESPSSRISMSGRSYSSEDGLHGGKIHGYVRPSAPPRGSQERSGDSGISAGDAGSPANPMVLASEDFSSSSPVLDTSSNIKGNKALVGKISSADRMMKCWVPEQDLDESSSDFEQEPMIIPPTVSSTEKPGISPSHPKSPTPKQFPINSSRLFEGKRASAVVSDSDSKYFSSSGDHPHSSEASRRFYSRSSKSKESSKRSGGAVTALSATSKHLQQQQQSSSGVNKLRKSSASNAPNVSNSNGFVGLDTNWFLSRSEPNSLHVLGAEVVVVGGGSREVVVGRNKKLMIPKNDRDDEDEEFECELHLSDEEEDEDGSSDNNNNHNDFTRNKRKKEIGYGPSSMNLPNNNRRMKTKPSNSGSSSKPSPPAPRYDEFDDEENEYDKKLNLKKEQKKKEEDDEDIEEELMRDDLFDYLDQYEEGEFEREQELSASSAAQGNLPNVSTAKSNGNSAATDATNLIASNNTNAEMKVRSGTAASSVQKFSHNIMYLPSYDSRRLAGGGNQFQRRARSVDHLDTSEGGGSSLFIRNRNGYSPQGRPSGDEEDGGRGRSKLKKLRAPPPPNSKPKAVAVRKQSEPCFPSGASGEILLGDKMMSLEEEERRAANKKKFKFQSTLRVQERKKIEEELTREARQQEEQRLREMEAMKRVEEEFQKKRAKEKLEAQEALAKLNGGGNVSRIDLSVGGGMCPVTVGQQQHTHQQMSPGIKEFKELNVERKSSYPIGRKKEALSHQPSTSSSSGSGPNLMSKRQEPEGAPAAPNSFCNSSVSCSGGSGGGGDLRKELISASKKRNALVNGGHTQGTQELSEYRQETSRQYCDYRSRPGRQQSLSPARFNPSSSSDIFPISSRRKGGAGGSSYSGGSKMSARSSTVHPEVVCDIPVKPTPYMVNASRLGGSTLNLVSEERPSSILGSMNNLSSPSSVISDNYRKDWVQHSSRGGPSGGGGVSSILQGGRASSVISLHSAPGYSSAASDLNFRNSTSDLSRLHHHLGQSSPRYLHEKGPANRQYSTSPTSSSPVLQIRREASENSKSKKDKSSRGSPVRIMSRSNTTVISIGAPLPYRNVMKKKRDTSPFQPHPQPFTKVKEYRPVAFKPNPSSTTAVN